MNPLDIFTNVVRAKEIVTVLARYGFGDLLSQLGIPKPWLNILVREEVLRMNLGQRIRVVFEELGPTFVKFGQILSTRPDLLPEMLLKEFKLLRNQVRPVAWEQMEKILLRELEGSLEDHFSDFNQEPIAAGSIGQVYRARLKGSDAEVAVKVLKPGIRKAVRADLEIIGWLAKQAHEKFEDIQPFSIPDIVEETGRGIRQELDFTIEARNTALFNALNPEPEKIFAPQVHDAFTTSRLTVYEWIEGTAPETVELSPEQAKELALVGGNSIFHQIVIAGFFHADPHGGNILITKDKRLCLVDWGLTGLLTREMRYFLADLFGAIASMDAEKVVRVATLMAVTKNRIDSGKLERDVLFVLRQYEARFLRNEAIGQILFDLLYVFGSNGIYLAKDYSLLAKAILSIEETGLSLHPDFDIREVAGPYLKKLNYERWHPGNLLKSTYWSVLNQFNKLRDLPADVQRVFRHLEDGDISFKMKHEGLNYVGSAFNSGINRLVLGVIIAALLVGSSLIISSTISFQPDLFAFPTLLGTSGFLLSFVLGLWLAFDIIRHGKHR